MAALVAVVGALRTVGSSPAAAGNALRAVGMFEGPVAPPSVAPHLAEEFRWLQCTNAGWWQPEVEVGAMVRPGERLGAILDPIGDELEEMAAPLQGVVAFMTSSPAVAAGGLLLGIAGELTPLGPDRT